MNGLPYYPRYPRDFFDGTNGMSFELKGAYAMLLDLIYMCGGELYDEPRFIAGHMNCSVRAWGSYRAALIDRGKITVANGIISNFRADKELIIQRSFQDKQRINASQPRKNKDLGLAMAEPKPSHTDTDTEVRVERGKPLSRAPDGFDEFWQAVPRKVAKDKAVPAYAKALRKTDARTLIEAMRRYAQSRIGEDPQYTAHPASWLNAGRWQDEPTQHVQPIGKANGTDKQQRKLDAFIAGSTGAPPVDRGPDLYPALPLLAGGRP